MANWFVDSTAYAAVAPWSASHAYAPGAIVRQLAAPSVGNERCFRTALGGTSGGSEPTWVLTHGANAPTDGTVTDWVEVTGNATYNWQAPHARLANALASGWAAAGDTVFVGDDHAETQASAMTLAGAGTDAAPLLILCVDHNKASPGTYDLKSTARVTTTGANALSFAGAYYIYGIVFNGASGATAQGIAIGNGSGRQVFDSCQLNCPSTSSPVLAIGSASATTKTLLVNTSVSFGSTMATIALRGGEHRWRDTAPAITGANVPAKLFGNSSPGPAAIWMEGLDLSAAGGSTILVDGASIAAPQRFYLADCTLNASVTLTGTIASAAGAQIDLIRSDSGATTSRMDRYRYEGTLTSNSTLVRTGGAADGASAISLAMVTGASAQFTAPLESMPISIRNSLTFANRTVTLAGIANAASLPTNDQIWLEVEYLGSSATPLGARATSGKSNVLASGVALTADTSAWDSQAPARANSQAYALGQVHRVASNPGRVFFCTTAGTSAASEPAGYASAVDGGSVTDGTAVFRAGMRFKLTATLSAPQMAGYLHAVVKVAQASTTFWIDPLPVLDTNTGPTLDIDLTTGILDPRIAFARASSATYFDSTGTMQIASANVARLGFDPATLLPLGLIIEEQRTDSIANSSMVGAAVGTPGTLPAGWGSEHLPSGLTRSVVAVGTDGGIPYIDVRINGTTTDTSGYFNMGGVTAAAASQDWVGSFYRKLVAGSAANVNYAAMQINTTGTIVTISTGGLPTSGALYAQRATVRLTSTPAGTTGVQPYFIYSVVSGQPVDFTIRIGAPQLELGSLQTSPVLTTSGAATRAADIASLPVGSWFNPSAGTLQVEYILTALTRPGGGYPPVIALTGANPNTDYIDILADGGNVPGVLIAAARNAGVGILGPGTLGAVAAGQIDKAAFTYGPSGMLFSRAGLAPTSDSLHGSLPTIVALTLGAASVSFQTNGAKYLRRIRYWPRILSAAELQAATL